MGNEFHPSTYKHKSFSMFRLVVDTATDAVELFIPGKKYEKTCAFFEVITIWNGFLQNKNCFESIVEEKYNRNKSKIIAYTTFADVNYTVCMELLNKNMVLSKDESEYSKKSFTKLTRKFMYEKELIPFGFVKPGDTNVGRNAWYYFENYMYEELRTKWDSLFDTVHCGKDNEWVKVELPTYIINSKTFRRFMQKHESVIKDHEYNIRFVCPNQAKKENISVEKAQQD